MIIPDALINSVFWCRKEAEVRPQAYLRIMFRRRAGDKGLGFRECQP